MVFQHRDYNGALVFFLQAYDLHPWNAEAMEGLDAVIDVVVSEKIGDDPLSIQTKLEQAEAMLSYPQLAENTRLKKFCKQLREQLSQ